ncbi:hypothetical protein GGS20DRAFT_559045 [Poronia punctata]|nr:hypothetical protein GGS20DRAFT_559045 [Poronia punctata]
MLPASRSLIPIGESMDVEDAAEAGGGVYHVYFHPISSQYLSVLTVSRCAHPLPVQVSAMDSRIPHSLRLQPFLRTSYQRFSVKWSFLSCVFIFNLGFLICGVAPNSAALIVGRAIVSAGSSGPFPDALIIIALAAPPEKPPYHLNTGFIAAVYGIAFLGVYTGPARTPRPTASLRIMRQRSISSGALFSLWSGLPSSPSCTTFTSGFKPSTA